MSRMGSAHLTSILSRPFSGIEYLQTVPSSEAPIQKSFCYASAMWTLLLVICTYTGYDTSAVLLRVVEDVGFSLIASPE